MKTTEITADNWTMSEPIITEYIPMFYNEETKKGKVLFKHSFSVCLERTTEDFQKFIKICVEKLKANPNTRDFVKESKDGNSHYIHLKISDSMRVFADSKTEIKDYDLTEICKNNDIQCALSLRYSSYEGKTGLSLTVCQIRYKPKESKFESFMFD